MENNKIKNKNNNLSNSMVFGWWPQTKKFIYPIEVKNKESKRVLIKVSWQKVCHSENQTKVFLISMILRNGAQFFPSISFHPGTAASPVLCQKFSRAFLLDRKHHILVEKLYRKEPNNESSGQKWNRFCYSFLYWILLNLAMCSISNIFKHYSSFFNVFLAFGVLYVSCRVRLHK